jgi:hypothetical protein
MKVCRREIYLDLLILECINVEMKCVTFLSHFGALNINESCKYAANNFAMPVRLSSCNNSGMLSEFSSHLIADLHSINKVIMVLNFCGIRWFLHTNQENSSFIPRKRRLGGCDQVNEVATSLALLVLLIVQKI